VRRGEVLQKDQGRGQKSCKGFHQKESKEKRKGCELYKEGKGGRKRLPRKCKEKGGRKTKRVTRNDQG